MTSHDIWQLMTWNQQHLPWILGSGAVGLLGLTALKKKRHRHTTPYGQWATTRELRNASLLSTQGFVLGRHGRWILRYGGRGHMLVVASTQSGKTSSLVIPTLLEPHLDRSVDPPQDTSLIIHDPKGELHACSADYRSTVSKVIYLAPCSSVSHHRNPLDAIRLDKAQEVADIQLISETLCNPDGDEPHTETERHFLELTSDMLSGLILYGLRSGRGMTLGALNAFTLQPWAQIIADLRLDPHPLIQRTVEIFNRLDDKQHGGVLATIARALRLFNDPVVARMTDDSDFAESELRRGKQPLSIYLSVPFNHMSRLRALTRLFTKQLLGSALEELSMWDFKVDCLIDEFPSLRRLNVLSDALNHAAGFGVRLCLITPSLEEVIQTYGQHHNFLAGTQVQVYFGLNDEATARRVAERLGKQTVIQERTTYHNRQRSVTRERVEKPLLSADALLHLPPKNIVVVAGTTQVLLTQTPWYKTSPWKHRGVSHV